MQFHIRTEKDKVTVLADVAKIEVTEVIGPGEDDIVESYSRIIRFVGYSGESIEVFCDAVAENQLRLHRVRELKPVKKPKEVDWLNPTVYKGNIGDEQE